MNLLSLQDYKDANDIDLIDSAYTVMETAYGVDSETLATFKDKPAKAIWATYRFQLLNCCGCETYIDRWKYRFADIAYNMLEKYKVLFAAYEELKSGLGSIDSTGTIVTHSEGKTHTDGDNSNTATFENIPQYTGASDQEWVNNRNKNNGSVSADGTTNTDVSVTSKSALGMLPAELADKMRNALFNPYEEYAREFEKLFVPYYASGCECL